MSHLVLPRSRQAWIAKMLIVGLLPLVPPGTAAAGDVAGVSRSPLPADVQLVGLGPEQVEVVDQALALFADANLVLPRIVIRATPDRTICDGHDGLTTPHQRWVEVSICTLYRGTRERHVILHELAHAWTTFSLSSENRAAFQALRGWRYWLDYSRAEWRDNGGEQAAEIIAWGLNDGIAPAVAIDHRSCAELRNGYLALTGSQPLHGLTKICSAATRGAFS